MRRYQGWLFIITLALTAWGCNKSDQTTESVAAVSPTGVQPQNASAANADPASKLEGPKRTVYEFLEALRTGNDDKANSLLSAIAQKKTVEMDCRLTPTASDTAKFSIDNVKYIGEDGAHVAMTWTDTSLDGKATADKAVWVVRKEAEGWRVVGMAVVVVADEDPLVLNFEDPADVKKKLEDINNRMNPQPAAGETENLQAEQKDNSDSSLRR
jgi:hypothetical protein